MAFGWDVARDPYDAAVRAAAVQVQSASRVLRSAARRRAAGAPAPGDRAALEIAVHEARKSLRRACALVAWMRPVVDPAAGAALAQRLRGARRRLAEARDGSVLVGALLSAWQDAEAGRSGAPAASFADATATLAPLIDRLTRDRDVGLALLQGVDASPAGSVLRALGADLRRARTDLRGLRWSGSGDALLRRGLARLHRRAVAAGRDALERPDVDRLHAARTRWKELACVVQWLQPAWPRLLGAWLDDVDELTDLIGEHHDQAVLRARLAPWSGEIDEALLTRTLAASELRGDRLRRAALPRLARLVAEPTEAFVLRHHAYAVAARRRPDA